MTSGLDPLTPPREAFSEALAIVNQEGGLCAVRGLALAAQALMEERQFDVAEHLFLAVAGWAGTGAVSARDARFQVEVANERGRLLRHQGRLDEAEQLFRQALQRARELGDVILAGVVSNNLAQTLIETEADGTGRTDEAIVLLEQNIERLSGEDERRHRAVAYHHLATALRSRDPHAAESYFKQDIEVCRSLGDDSSLADALDQYGVFLADRGRHGESQRVLDEELNSLDPMDESHRKARALANLGRSCLADAAARGDSRGLERAVELLTHSRQAFESLDEPAMLAPTLENLGRAQYRLGDHEAGIASLKASMEQYRRTSGGDVVARDIQRELDELV